MKNLISFWCLIALPGFCFGQQYWEKMYPSPSFSNGTEEATCVAKGDHGDYWMVTKNYSYSTLKSSETLVHLDSTGQLLGAPPLQWDSNTNYAETNQLFLLSDSSMLAVGFSVQIQPNIEKGYLRKINRDGTLIWILNNYLGNLFFKKYDQAVELPDGRIVVLAERYKAGGYLGVSLLYLDQAGQVLSHIPVHDAQDSTYTEYVRSAVFTPQGDCMIRFKTGFGNDSKNILAFIDSTGSVLAADTIYDDNVKLTTTPDGNFASIWTRYAPVGDSRYAMLTKYDRQGQRIWAKEHELPNDMYNFLQFTATQDNGFVGLQYYMDYSSGDPYPLQTRFWTRFTADGELQHLSKVFWSAALPSIYEFPGSMILSSGNSVFGAASYREYTYPEGQIRPLYFRLDSLGYALPNRVEGKIVLDQDQSCAADPDEPGLEGFMLRLQQPGQDPKYVRSGPDGRFEMEAEMGAYSLDVFPPGAQWKPCVNTLPINFNARYDTITVSIPVQSVSLSPVIETEAVLSSLHRCANNTVEILYANRGAAESDSILLLVALDPAMTYLSSGIAPKAIQGDTLTFWLPGLPVDSVERFKVKFRLECSASVSGQTHSVSVWTQAPILVPAWNGADLQVNARCIQDSTVRIEISNTGKAGTPLPLPYQVIHNDAIWLSSVLQMAPGQQASSFFQADGGYWYVTIQQPDGHPWLRYAAAGLEGCGGATDPGALLQWPMQDEAMFAARECWPEGKTAAANFIAVAPVGLGSTHAITATDDLEYTIFFRNQNEHSALSPFLRDTLSPWLDPATLRITASSAPCQAVFEPDHVLRFNFPWLALQPEFLDPANCSGYVRFRIKPFADAPAGTPIRTASFFWPNSDNPFYPVRDATLHTIGVSIPVSVSDPATKTMGLELIPNPATDRVQINVAADDFQTNHLVLRDISGRVLYQTVFTGAHFNLERPETWADGLYFLEIQTDSGATAVDKLMLVSH